MLAGLLDPNDPKIQRSLGKVAGGVFSTVGELLHRGRTPEATHGPNDVWRPTEDERARFSSPAGELLARHLPIRWLAAAYPFLELLGDGSELGGVVTGYVTRNRDDEARLRAMIVEELARQNGERQPPEGAPE